MSSLPRFLTTRRAYSSFFSSRQGGGRYFTSSKPAKPAVTKRDGKHSPRSTAITTTSASDTLETTSPTTEEPPKDPQTPGETTNKPSTTLLSDNATPTPLSDSQPAFPHPLLTPNFRHAQIPPHPILDIKDLRVHEFFAAHRPLLHLQDPASLWKPSLPPTAPVFEPPVASAMSISTSTAIQEVVDADAEVARQLTRALSMHRAGGAAAWEATLKRLGLDVSQSPERVEENLKLAQEWEDVQMDSTRRKKRKKMKKHKLKKRRKATRAERLKLK
ncbi:hypothetical protein DL96DRAFT_1229019 [Flagelloscypha sp. PMI_526]|nr:hypothetical protein DL96DRAFT_1229019 [Flagelloscypha sp. PMI_526]